MKKKGQVMQNLSVLGIGVATITVILAVTFLVMAQLRTQIVDDGYVCENSGIVYNSTNNYCCTYINCSYGGTSTIYNSTNQGPLSNAMNSTQTLTNAAYTVPGWVPLIILVAIGGIILSLVAVFRR